MVLRVSDMLMTSAPLSTAQRTASAIWSSFDFSALVSWPNATDGQQVGLGRDADHAVAVAGAAAREERGDHRAVVRVAADRGLPVGGAEAGDIRAARDRALSSATSPFTPVSITATVTPSPRVVFHAV